MDGSRHPDEESSQEELKTQLALAGARLMHASFQGLQLL